MVGAAPPSLFRHFLVSNGILFGPLMLLLTLALVCLIVWLAFALRRGKAASRGLVPRLTEAAGAGPERVAELAGADPSYLQGQLQREYRFYR